MRLLKSLIILFNKWFLTRAILKFIVDTFVSFLLFNLKRNKSVKSIYVTGSMATGHAIYGISDIDFIIIADKRVKYDFRKLHIFLSRLCLYIPLMGKLNDVFGNIIEYTAFMKDGFSHPSKIYYSLNRVKFVHGTDYLKDVSIDVLDYISFFEVQYDHLLRTIGKTELSRFYDRKNKLLLDLCESENFKKYFSTLITTPQIKDIQTYEDFFSQINFINPEYVKIQTSGVIKAEEISLAFMSNWPNNLFWGLPCPYTGTKDIGITFESEAELRDFFENKDKKVSKEFILSLRLGSFQIFVTPLTNIILSRWRTPFLWGDSQIHPEAFKWLQTELRHHRRFIKKTKYTPFFSNRTNDFGYLERLSNDGFIADRQTQRFNSQIVNEKICKIPNKADFYESLQDLKGILMKQTDRAQKTVTLCICTKNRAKLLEQTLESVCAQTVIPDEVLLIDNNSSDETTKIIQRYSKTLPIKSFVREDNTISKLRHFAATTASSDIVAFTDDDALLEKDWVYHVKRSFESDEHLKLLGGYMYHWEQKEDTATELFHRYILGVRT